MNILPRASLVPCCARCTGLSAGRVSRQRRFGKLETLKYVLEKAELETSKKLEEVRRAPRFPLSLVAAMELSVAQDGSLPAAARVVIWTRLVKIYGSLRMDDLQRIKPSMVKLTSTGIVAKLLRSTSDHVSHWHHWVTSRS